METNGGGVFRQHSDHWVAGCGVCGLFGVSAEAGEEQEGSGEEDVEGRWKIGCYGGRRERSAEKRAGSLFAE